MGAGSVLTRMSSEPKRPREPLLSKQYSRMRPCRRGCRAKFQTAGETAASLRGRLHPTLAGRGRSGPRRCRCKRRPPPPRSRPGWSAPNRRRRRRRRHRRRRRRRRRRRPARPPAQPAPSTRSRTGSRRLGRGSPPRAPTRACPCHVQDMCVPRRGGPPRAPRTGRTGIRSQPRVPGR